MRIKKYLPKYLFEISDFNDTALAIDKEFDLMDKALDNIENSTLTYHNDEKGLKKLEIIYGIKNKDDENLKDRKEFLRAKMRGVGVVNADFVKSLASAYNCGDIDIKEIYKSYKIILKFISIYGRPSNLKKFKEIIRTFIPAHLDIEYVFSYMTWKERDNYNKQWSEWDNLNLNWEQYEGYQG